MGLLQVREHDWFRKKHPCTAPPVTVPARNDDVTISTTVIPYLLDLHFPPRDDDDEDEVVERGDHYVTTGHEWNQQDSVKSNPSKSKEQQGDVEEKTTKCIKVRRL